MRRDEPLIITADWHLRKDVPRCRTIPEEEWIGYQLERVESVLKQAVLHNADVLIAGDIFDKARAESDELISRLISLFLSFKNTKIAVLPGNHDLLYHSMNYIYRSTIGQLWALMEKGNTNIVFPWDLQGVVGAPFGIEETYGVNPKSKQPVRVLHYLTFPHKKDIPPYIEDAECSESLREKYDEPIIITGDYHVNWIIDTEARIVINPGCLTVQAADMEKYTPGFYLLDDGSYEFIELPEEPETIVSDYLKEEEQRDERISAFVAGLTKENKTTLDFNSNLEQAINGLKKDKKQKISSKIQSWR